MDRQRRAARAAGALIVLALVASAVSASAETTPARWPCLDGAIVLSTRPVASWERGPARVEQLPSDHNDDLFLTRDVDEARLPGSLRSLRGRAVRTLDYEGKECPATIDGFRLLAVADAPAAERTRWEKVSEPPGGGETRPNLARLAWQHSRRFLLATLNTDCNPGA